MIDPYAMLGVEREADEAAIKAAYRQVAKSAHPDQGGDAAAFGKLQAAYDLLRDPVRRKLFDDTGYDPQLADPRDLKGLLVIETLVNEVILDEREPGTFDPVAAMRRKLSDDIVKSRFHILELERHRTRVRQHIDRLGRRPEADVLGSMLRARSQSIADAIRGAEGQIEVIEQAYLMLEGYRYELEAPRDFDPAGGQERGREGGREGLQEARPDGHGAEGHRPEGHGPGHRAGRRDEAAE